MDKDIGVVDAYRLQAPDIGAIAALMPPVEQAFRDEEFVHLMSLKGQPFRIANLGFSLYERAWTLRCMDNLLMDMVEHPEFVDALLDVPAENILALVEVFRTQQQ